MDREKFVKELGEFVEDYISSEVINLVDKNKILDYSTAWNKEIIMEELIKRIDEYRLYEEEGFPFQSYVDKFLSEMPVPIEDAFSLDKQ